jgi:HPt (histidine-containing phosphotransfer) domain-containing protein
MHGQSQTAQHIRDALAQSDTDVAERLAHTAKGLAGNVGAGPVQNAAAALEQAIHTTQPPDRIEACLSNFEQAFAALQKELAPVLDSLAEGASMDATDAVTQERSKVLANLERLLQDDDPEAVDYFAAHNIAMREHLSTLDYQSLQAALENYDLDAALLALQTTPRGIRH